jgi:hypothetical protein
MREYDLLTEMVAINKNLGLGICFRDQNDNTVL